uniref:Uncharacterized protein n=1 Tax=Arundo donax TaxID=35708 RepID=A0A0A8Y7R6_ARUDO
MVCNNMRAALISHLSKYLRLPNCNKYLINP